MCGIPVGSGGGFNHGDKRFDKIMRIGIPDLSMHFMSCVECLGNVNYVIIFKCPKSMLEYYIPKGFTILECNDNNLGKFQMR